MLLRFWAFIYRLTGYYSNYARLKEYQYLKANFNKIKKIVDKEDLSLKNAISIHIGLWQAHNGFYRSWGHVRPKKRK